MDATDAGEHLRMLDGIVRATDRVVRVPPTILLSVGLFACAILALIQARQLGLPIPPDQYLQPPLFLLMFAVIGFTAWKGRHAERTALVDGYAAAAFFAAFLVAMTLNVTAQHRIVSAAGMGLIWAGAFCMALLIVGAIGSRLLLAGGAAMLAAIAAASLVQPWLPGLLSLGWFVGYALPGLILSLRTPDGRAAAL